MGSGWGLDAVQVFLDGAGDMAVAISDLRFVVAHVVGVVGARLREAGVGARGLVVDLLLLADEHGVDACGVLLEQLVVVALLNEAALLEHEDVVSVPDR